MGTLSGDSAWPASAEVEQGWGAGCGRLSPALTYPLGSFVHRPLWLVGLLCATQDRTSRVRFQPAGCLALVKPGLWQPCVCVIPPLYPFLVLSPTVPLWLSSCATHREFGWEDPEQHLSGPVAGESFGEDVTLARSRGTLGAQSSRNFPFLSWRGK